MTVLAQRATRLRTEPYRTPSKKRLLAVFTRPRFAAYSAAIMERVPPLTALVLRKPIGFHLPFFRYGLTVDHTKQVYSYAIVKQTL
jgi:hypothetical protein